METRNHTIITRLRDYYPQLSGVQQRIADYIGEHPDEAMFLTAAQLGERIGASESSVVRFAQAIGFGGYPEFRRELRARVRERILYAQETSMHGKLLAPGPNLLADVAQFDIALIQETAAQLDPQVLERCVEYILAADQVYVTGHRASYALAEFFATTLQQGLGVGVPLSFGSGMAFDTMAAAKENGVVIAVSITPYSQQTLDILAAARTQRLYRVAITDHPLGAPARLASDVIVFETVFHGVTSSYAGAMTIFRALLVMLTHRAPDRIERFAARFQALQAPFRTVYIGDDPRHSPVIAADSGAEM